MGRRRPTRECESVEIPETEALEIPKVETFPEANIPPLAYHECGVGWSHYILVEVVDVE